jgi:hypothetical protein
LNRHSGGVVFLDSPSDKELMKSADLIGVGGDSKLNFSNGPRAGGIHEAGKQPPEGEDSLRYSPQWRKSDVRDKQAEEMVGEGYLERAPLHRCDYYLL